MKSYMKALLALATCGLALTAQSATPWAIWTDFDGLTANTPLKPTYGFTQNSIDASKWTFQLAGAAEVTTDKALSTGGTTAPYIDTNGTLNLGYGGNKFTLVMKVKGVPTSDLPSKPILWALGGHIGAGLKIVDNAPVVKGVWNRQIWTTTHTDVSVASLTADGSAVLSFDIDSCTGSAGGLRIRYLGGTNNDFSANTQITWGGLRANPTEITKIPFGNVDDGTADGLDYTIEKIALFHGAVTHAELTSFVNTSDFTVTAITAHATITKVPSGAAFVLSDGVTLDLRGAAFGEEKVSVTFAEGATSATVKIYDIDKGKLNELPSGVTLIEERPDATITWKNENTTWNADTEWTLDGATTKFQEGDTVVFDLEEDLELTVSESFNPEAIIVKGAKLTIKASQQITTQVNSTTTLEAGGSLDVSNVGNSSATHLKAVSIGAGCTFIGNEDQTTSITGSGTWYFKSSTEVEYIEDYNTLTLQLGDGTTLATSIAIPNTAKLILEGGASFHMRNGFGNTPALGHIYAPIEIATSALTKAAKFRGSLYGNSTIIHGDVTLNGNLELVEIANDNWNNLYTIEGKISGPGKLTHADAGNSIRLTNTGNDFEGGLFVSAGSTSDSSLTVASAGKGDVTIEEGKYLTVYAGGTLNILSGQRLKGAGVLAGNVSFAEGSIIDTTQTVSVSGSVASAGAVTILLAEAPAESVTSIKVLTAESVTLPFSINIVYGEEQTSLTGWEASAGGDGLYILKPGSKKEATLTPPATGEDDLTWAGVWGESAPGGAEEATLILTENVTLDVGASVVPVGAVTVKKGEVETTPTLTLVNAQNLKSSQMVLDGVALAFAGATEAGTPADVTFPIVAEESIEAVSIVSGSVKLSSAESIFAGGITVKKNATLVAETLWGATIHLEDGANANFATQSGLATATGETPGVFTGTGTVNVTYSHGSNSIAAPNAATFKNSSDWKGTVKFTSASLRGTCFHLYGNSNSSLLLDGVSGWNAASSGDNVATFKKVTIGSNGWTVTDGGSSLVTVINAPIEGSGPITFEGNTPTQVYRFMGDLSGYTGDITVKSNYRLTFGDVTLTNNDANKGILVVAQGVTTPIAPGATWTVRNGFRLNGALDLTAAVTGDATGLSTISGALTGSGSVTLGEGRSLKVTGAVDSTITVTTNVASKVIEKTVTEEGTLYAVVAQALPVIPEVDENGNANAGAGKNPIEVPNGSTTTTVPMDVSSTAMEKIFEAANETKVTAISVAPTVSVVKPEGGTATAEEIAEAALEAVELFDDVVNVDATTGVATIEYSFGVERMTIKTIVVLENDGLKDAEVSKKCVVLLARVQGGGAETADFATGTAVTAWREGADGTLAQITDAITDFYTAGGVLVGTTPLATPGDIWTDYTGSSIGLKLIAVPYANFTAGTGSSTTHSLRIKAEK